ncbi:hypothetical protein YH65_10820 [Sulfurovum lithotrophicum]|uniref:Uncharacterized protein n=1 Tax=Sulfurovum lithotrophicum TaxID=206403 RepID=A0A7U4RRH6_9BACT|nr:hypothetical protein [Sulfurovum lithotrophicum]AKF25822.1 hypothetical protein YH65_10820 [Sulfurovum lithotrophicum]
MDDCTRFVLNPISSIDPADTKKNSISKSCKGKKNNIKKHAQNKRAYTPQTKILKLFKEYYSINKTKIEVFRQISKELNISVKAVEKAYYKKS